MSQSYASGNEAGPTGLMTLPNELLIKILEELLTVPRTRAQLPTQDPVSGKLYSQILRTCSRLYQLGSKMLAQNGFVALDTSADLFGPLARQCSLFPREHCYRGSRLSALPAMTFVLNDRREDRPNRMYIFHFRHMYFITRYLLGYLRTNFEARTLTLLIHRESLPGFYSREEAAAKMYLEPLHPVLNGEFREIQFVSQGAVGHGTTITFTPSSESLWYIQHDLQNRHGIILDILNGIRRDREPRRIQRWDPRPALEHWMQALNRMLIFASSGVWDLNQDWEVYFFKICTDISDQIQRNPPATDLTPRLLSTFRRLIRDIAFLGAVVFLNLSYCPELLPAFYHRNRDRAQLLSLAETYMVEATRGSDSARAPDELIGSWYKSWVIAEIIAGRPIVNNPETGESSLMKAFKIFDSCLWKLDPTAPAFPNVFPATSAWVDRKVEMSYDLQQSYMESQGVGWTEWNAEGNLRGKFIRKMNKEIYCDVVMNYRPGGDIYRNALPADIDAWIAAVRDGNAIVLREE
jgi:hypothetical protein